MAEAAVLVSIQPYPRIQNGTSSQRIPVFSISGMYIVIIVLMAVASAAVIIGVAYAVYLRIKRERRKRIDK